MSFPPPSVLSTVLYTDRIISTLDFQFKVNGFIPTKKRNTILQLSASHFFQTFQSMNGCKSVDLRKKACFKECVI